MSKTTTDGNNSKKSKRMSPILFGVLIFVLMLVGMIVNSFGACVWSAAFPPAWRVAFNQGMKRAKVNRPEGIKMMEAALAECEKSSDGHDEKAKLFYDYGAWNFNEKGLPNRFAISKKSYARCVALTDNKDRKAMALQMMANCDDYAGIAGDGEKNADEAWKMRQEDGNTNPAALWGTIEAMGRAHIRAGHYDQAIPSFKQAQEMADKANLGEGIHAAQSTGDLACAYALDGNRELGDKTFLEAIQRYDKIDGACNASSERTIAEYARALKQAGDVESAKKLAAKLDNPETLDDIGPFFDAYFM